MKKFLFRRMASVALASALAISAVPAWGIGTVEAAEEDILTIYASEINEAAAKNEGNYNGEDYTLDNNNLTVNEKNQYGEVVLELNEDLHLYDVTIYGTTTINGPKTLYLDKNLNDNDIDMDIYGKLTVDKDATISLGAKDSDVHIYDYNNVKGSLYSKKGNFIYNDHGSVRVSGNAYIYDGNYKATGADYMIMADGAISVSGGNFTTEGNEKVLSVLFGDSVSISGGTFDCESDYLGLCSAYDMNISGGDINITSKDTLAIYCYDGNLNISGGNVVANLDIEYVKPDGVIKCNKFNFSGGYLETNVPEHAKNIFVANKKFDIAENCYIEQPEGAKFDADRYTIVGKGNIFPTKVVMKEKPDLSKAEISGIEDKEYTGSAITQNAVVTIEGTTLTEGTDYVIEYSDNTEIGTATMTFSPIEGSNTLGTASKTFQITKADDDKKDDVKKDDDQKDGDKKDDDKKDDKKDDNKAEKKYSNEWVDGKWYDADGKQTYKGTMSWKCNDKGWWIEDSEGWYPQSQWVKIDGKWYYFCADGYMDYSEYRDGCWLGSDGAWVEEYYGGTWKQNSTGWWYEDASGWYPHSQWVWIDGSCYYFGADGLMLTNQYVDGYWVGADGASQ